MLVLSCIVLILKIQGPPHYWNAFLLFKVVTTLPKNSEANDMSIESSNIVLFEIGKKLGVASS